MRQPGFLLFGSVAVILALCGAFALGAFAYQTVVGNEANLLRYLLVSGFIFIAVNAAFLFIYGFVALGQRQLSDLERIAWVVLMLVFPVLGALAFFLVSPGDQKP